MVSPIDYTTNVQQPFQAAAQGYQFGAGIRDDQQQQQQLQLLQQQQQQIMAARQAVIQNPTATNYANLILTDPKSYQATQAAWQTRNTDQQQTFAGDLGVIGSAIINKQPQLAADMLTKQADLIEQQTGAPTPESQSKRALAQLAIDHPEVALGKVLALSDANPAGKQVADGLRKQLTQGADVTKANAEATSATADAQVKASTVGDQVQAAGLKNAQTQQEIDASKLAGRISELNVQIAQANSETERGRLTLERDKLTQQQAQLRQGQGQAAQDSLDAASNALQTVQSIKTHPGLDGFFTGNGTMAGMLAGKIPGTDRQALQGWVDSLKSQLAFDKLMQMKTASPTGASGLGALSEGELKALSAQAGNLDLNSKDFPAVLANVEKYLNKSQQTTLSRPGAPTSGGAVILTSPKYGAVREGDINRVMQQNPGATRAQVIQFLQQGQTIPTR